MSSSLLKKAALLTLLLVGSSHSLYAASNVTTDGISIKDQRECLYRWIKRIESTDIDYPFVDQIYKEDFPGIEIGTVYSPSLETADELFGDRTRLLAFCEELKEMPVVTLEEIEKEYYFLLSKSLFNFEENGQSYPNDLEKLKENTNLHLIKLDGSSSMTETKPYAKMIENNLKEMMIVKTMKKQMKDGSNAKANLDKFVGNGDRSKQWLVLAIGSMLGAGGRHLFSKLSNKKGGATKNDRKRKRRRASLTRSRTALSS